MKKILLATTFLVVASSANAGNCPYVKEGGELVDKINSLLRTDDGWHVCSDIGMAQVREVIHLDQRLFVVQTKAAGHPNCDHKGSTPAEIAEKISSGYYMLKYCASLPKEERERLTRETREKWKKKNMAKAAPPPPPPAPTPLLDKKPWVATWTQEDCNNANAAEKATAAFYNKCTDGDDKAPRKLATSPTPRTNPPQEPKPSTSGNCLVERGTLDIVDHDCKPQTPSAGRPPPYPKGVTAHPRPDGAPPIEHTPQGQSSVTWNTFPKDAPVGGRLGTSHRWTAPADLDARAKSWCETANETTRETAAYFNACVSDGPDSGPAYLDAADEWIAKARTARGNDLHLALRNVEVAFILAAAAFDKSNDPGKAQAARYEVARMKLIRFIESNEASGGKTTAKECNDVFKVFKDINPDGSKGVNDRVSTITRICEPIIGE